MLKFCWRNGFSIGIIVGGTVAIITLAWFAGLNYCPNHPCYYQPADSSPNEEASHGVWQVPQTIRRTFSYESEPQYSGGNPTRHEYYDLRAQERVAHATDWIAWITLASAVFGAIGLGALVWTLRLQRSANAILIGDQRPWISAEVTITDGLGYEIGDGQKILRIRFNVRLKNTGRSGAKVRFGKTYSITKQGDPELPSVAPEEGDNATIYSVLPDETVHIHVPWSWPSEGLAADVQDGGFRPALVINIAYSQYAETSPEWFNRRAYTVWHRRDDGSLPAIKIADIPTVEKIKPCGLYIKAGKSMAN